MSKSIITGKSKLAQSAGETENKEKLDLIKTTKKPALKTYRLYPDDISRLKKITATMNQATHKNISETAAIRALIVLGAHASGEKLIKALRETI